MSKLAALLKTEKSYRRSHFVWGSLILQQWFWQSTDSSLHREKVGKIIIHERIGRFSIIKLFFPPLDAVMIKAARELGFAACKLLCLIVESAVNCTLPSFARGIDLLPCWNLFIILKTLSRS